MAAETLYQLHDDERFDLVVVDTPPSRNALDFLEAPGVLARFLDHRLFRLLMLPARGGMRVVNAATQPLLRAIGKVVGSDVLADAVAFFQAFAGMEGGFRQRAEVGDRAPALRRDAVRARRRRRTGTPSPRRRGSPASSPARGIDRFAGVANRVHPRSGRARRPTPTARERPPRPRAEPTRRRCGATSPSCARSPKPTAPSSVPFTDLLGPAPLAEVPLLAGDVHDLDGLVEIREHLFAR